MNTATFKSLAEPLHRNASKTDANEVSQNPGELRGPALTLPQGMRSAGRDPGQEGALHSSGKQGGTAAGRGAGRALGGPRRHA